MYLHRPRGIAGILDKGEKHERYQDKKKKTWKNPLAVWGAKGGNHEVPTPEWKIHIKFERHKALRSQQKNWKISLRI